MKTILFCYITPFHPERGGIGRVTHVLTLEFIRRGYRVLYLIYPSAITIRHEYDYPVPLAYFPSSDCLSQENIEFYHRFICENHVDIVINQSGVSRDALLFHNTGNTTTKVITVIHNTPVWYAHHTWQQMAQIKRDGFIEYLKRIARLCLTYKIKCRILNECRDSYRKIVPLTDKLCLLSHKFIPDIHDLIGTKYDNKIVVIPNPNAFSQSAISDKVTEKYIKMKKILWVGLLDHVEKQPMAIIKIWKILSKINQDWKLVIVGGGNMLPFYEHLAKKMKLYNIEFKGFATPEYHDASILCLTSIHEGWSMVLTEAMQNGTVPIAFNSFASVTDIISSGENGELVTPFKIKEYCKKLAHLMNDEMYRERLAKNAYDSVKKFDVKNVVNQWENIFENFAIGNE